MKRAYLWVRPLVTVEKLPIASRELLDWLQAPPAPQPSRPTPTIRSDSPRRLAAYVSAAVQGEHDTLAATSSGRHYVTLKSAIRLGGLVVAGMLSEADARDALIAANTVNGYIAKVGRAAVERTISDGLAYGAQYPRQVGKP